MHPLVPFLVGKVKHPMGNRVANYQKCIRTTDIDEVGDSTHLTFFEMLGNWSFGDYFKEKAIEMSWEFLTGKEWLNINPERISVTVFSGDELAPRDEEAAEIWETVGIPSERLFYLPREDNWWGPAGETGPCGPDTEMFVDTGLPKCSDGCKPGCNCGKYFEIWNDVFMTYNKTKDGQFKPLVQKNVDTGMGVERTAAILQGKKTVFDIEVLKPLVDLICTQAEIENPTSAQLKAIRIITDHVRTVAFVLADDKGIVPSNIEQGYVIRRLIRRSIRQLRVLDLPDSFIEDLARLVIEIHEDDYDELKRNSEFVYEQIRIETKRFSKALTQGTRKLNKILDQTNTITGIDAFNLYQSFGFPPELTFDIAKDKGISVDLSSFKEEFERHRDISRMATDKKFGSGLADHSEETTRLHTATHLLQAALRKTIGPHVQQRGSNVTRERLRFDFTHGSKLTPKELKETEKVINEVIERNLPVRRETMSVREALERGALGFFTRTYSDKEEVSVYSIGDEDICVSSI